MYLPTDIWCLIFNFSLDFQSILTLHSSINKIKLTCKRFNSLLKSKHALLFWKRLYRTLGCKRNFKSTVSAIKYFHPDNFFTISKIDGIRFSGDVDLCRNWLIFKSKHDCQMTLIFETPNGECEVEYVDSYGIFGKYVITATGLPKETTVWEQTETGYEAILKYPTTTILDGSFYRNITNPVCIFECNGLGMVICSEDDQITVIHPDGTQKVLGKCAYVFTKCGLYFCDDRGIWFYDFSTRSRKRLKCLVKVGDVVRFCLETSMIIAFGENETYGIDLREDRRIWTISEHISEYKFKTHRYGIFTVFKDNKFRFYNIFTGKLFYIYDASHISYLGYKYSDILIRNNKFGYEVILIAPYN